ILCLGFWLISLRDFSRIERRPSTSGSFFLSLGADAFEAPPADISPWNRLLKDAGADANASSNDIESGVRFGICLNLGRHFLQKVCRLGSGINCTLMATPHKAQTASYSIDCSAGLFTGAAYGDPPAPPSRAKRSGAGGGESNTRASFGCDSDDKPDELLQLAICSSTSSRGVLYFSRERLMISSLKLFCGLGIGGKVSAENALEVTPLIISFR